MSDPRRPVTAGKGKEGKDKKMKVVLKVSGKNAEDGPHHEVEIDGKFNKSIHALCECPEDAIIGRDLVDGKDICRYIRMGYDAAKRGEELTIEVIEEEN